MFEIKTVVPNYIKRCLILGYTLVHGEKKNNKYLKKSREVDLIEQQGNRIATKEKPRDYNLVCGRSKKREVKGKKKKGKERKEALTKYRTDSTYQIFPLLCLILCN